MKYFFAIFFTACFFTLHAQQNFSIIKGTIVDESDKPLSNVSIIVLGKDKGIVSSDSGTFTFRVIPEKAIALVFSHTGYASIQKNFFLSSGEIEKVKIILPIAINTINTVIVTDDRERKENGLVKINPKNALVLPSTTGGVEGLIKTLVGSNNELTSQYNVRGGSYDENIIYLNDFEIFRPYLVSNGQQEGLSFINPEMVRNINFYTGGFQAKYGDKLSSVLDIQYKKPTQTNGSVYMSLLEQGIFLSGNFKKGRSTYLFGARNKSNKNLLSNQPTVGAYIPSASDIQTQLNYSLSSKIQLEFLGILSSSKFTYYPESVKKTSSVFSPLFASNLGLDTYFDGLEKDNYQTSLLGFSLIHTPNKKLKLKWLLNQFCDVENENYDISGAYLFGDRDFDNNSSTFGEIINPLGAGVYQQYARNKLNIKIINAGHRGTAELGKSGNHFFQWGTNIEQTKINDQIKEFEYQDSAGYALPYNTADLQLFRAANSQTNLTINKYSGYIQDNIHLLSNAQDLSLQLGTRFNFNDLNKEFLLSPRIQMSWKPNWKQDVVFKLSTGIYNQPPFYRELKRYDGSLNKVVKAQKSIQYVAGMDYQLRSFNRAYRISTECYYKSMWDVIPYDIDNVKVKYFGTNSAKAYATGVELRLFSELVKDAESWISLGLMKTKENIKNDYYYDYKNVNGEIINPTTIDQTVTDSVKNEIGYLRRPTDRLITVGIFLQDYLATNKNFKVHLNMLYGSNMPFNIPNSSKYRNGLIVDPYIRVDIGFSALLLSEKNNRRSHSPFKSLENIWASLEIFNLINKENTISYQLIKDFANNTYAIPNKLTPRLINLKLLARF